MGNQIFGRPCKIKYTFVIFFKLQFGNHKYEFQQILINSNKYPCYFKKYHLPFLISDAKLIYLITFNNKNISVTVWNLRYGQFHRWTKIGSNYSMGANGWTSQGHIALASSMGWI